jgi:ribosomal protection tetracycline resistance protein
MIDGAILLLSAADGVLPRTELLFSMLRESGLPILIFINKTDLPSANIEAAYGEVQRLLSASAIGVPEEFFTGAPLPESFTEATSICLIRRRSVLRLEGSFRT